MRQHPYHPHVNLGRKGPLVFYERYEQICIRTYTEPKNPRTKEQQTNRGMYSLMTEISSKTKDFRAFCFQNLETYHNSHTAFVGIQMMWLKSLRDLDRNQIIQNLKWSIGHKKHPDWLKLEIQDKLLLTWEVTRRTLAQSDLCAQTMWIAYDCKSSFWEWRYNAGRRDAGLCELNLPEHWGEDEWYLWLMFYDNKRKTISRAARLIIPPGKTSVKTDYPDQKQNMHHENLVISSWLTSRDLRGKEHKFYMRDNKERLEWRPWL